MHTGRNLIAPIFRVAFWPALALIAVAALYPNLTLPEPSLTRGFTDKICHVLGFVVLVMLASIAWQWTLRLALSFVVAAVGLEFAQFLIQGRGVSLDDMLANLAGVMVGTSLLWMRARWWPRIDRHH